MDKNINLIYIFFFIILFVLILLLAICKIKQKHSIIIITLILTSLLSFRDYEQGLNDTLGTYYPIYQFSFTAPLENLFSGTDAKYTSVLFIIINKLISIFSNGSFRFYLIITSIFFVVSFELLIYFCTKDIFLPNIFFISFIFPYGFFLIRHCIAMSFIALAFIAFFKKRKILCLFFLILSALIHNTSLIFTFTIILLFLINKMHLLSKKTLYLYMVIVGILICAALLLPHIYYELIFTILPTDSKYYNLLTLQVYSLGDIWLIPFVSYLFFFLISWIYLPNYKSKNLILLLLSSVFILFISFSNVIQDLIRIAYFFTPALLILLGNVKDTLHIRDSKIANIGYSCLIILCIIYAFTISLPTNNIISW